MENRAREKDLPPTPRRLLETAIVVLVVALALFIGVSPWLPARSWREYQPDHVAVTGNDWPAARGSVQPLLGDMKIGWRCQLADARWLETRVSPANGFIAVSTLYPAGVAFFSNADRRFIGGRLLERGASPVGRMDLVYFRTETAFRIYGSNAIEDFDPATGESLGQQPRKQAVNLTSWSPVFRRKLLYSGHSILELGLPEVGDEAAIQQFRKWAEAEFHQPNLMVSTSGVDVTPSGDWMAVGRVRNPIEGPKSEVSLLHLNPFREEARLASDRLPANAHHIDSSPHAVAVSAKDGLWVALVLQNRAADGRMRMAVERHRVANGQFHREWRADLSENDWITHLRFVNDDRHLIFSYRNPSEQPHATFGILDAATGKRQLTILTSPKHNYPALDAISLSEDRSTLCFVDFSNDLHVVSIKDLLEYAKSRGIAELNLDQ